MSDEVLYDLDSLPWTQSNYGGVEHEYIFLWQSLWLAKKINRSTIKEVWRDGKTYRNLYYNGYKYWIVGNIINRKKDPASDTRASV